MHQYKNFLTPIECQELIQMIDANHTRSSVVEGGTDRTAMYLSMVNSGLSSMQTYYKYKDIKFGSPETTTTASEDYIPRGL